MQQIPVSSEGQVSIAKTLDSAPLWSSGQSINTSAIRSSSLQDKTVRLDSIEPAHLALLGQWLKPVSAVVTLFLCMLFTGQPSAPEYGALALACLLITRIVFSVPDLRRKGANRSLTSPKLSRLFIEWFCVISLLLVFAICLKLTNLYSRSVIFSWFTLTPFMLLIAHYLGAVVVEHSRSRIHRHIIIGVNELGLELARRTANSADMGDFMGFFDFRSPDRLPETSRDQFAGQCRDVAEYVRQHSIDAIYIALPITNAPRIEELLHGLRDTTASIFFVPNIFAFDLVQARCVAIDGIPAFSICDTPFTGMNAVRKRAVDIAFAFAALMITWPLLALAALAVKLSSPGPVLFKQRRYGLNGEEILVYKFRSMTVCEDGAVVRQATKCDQRITAVGKFLRRTSLDELPQLLNVLEGNMSFVGPRPHAVAHNEQYRKLISGYMIRHKVRPGITGWAQVNGLRGETATIEKMRLRVQYDLDYLRNWSLWLDIRIIARTVIMMILRDGNAY